MGGGDFLIFGEKCISFPLLVFMLIRLLVFSVYLLLCFRFLLVVVVMTTIPKVPYRVVSHLPIVFMFICIQTSNLLDSVLTDCNNKDDNNILISVMSNVIC